MFYIGLYERNIPWTGKKSNIKLRNATVKKAQEMANERPFWVSPISRQLEGGENVIFKEKFQNWSNSLPISVPTLAVGLKHFKS